MFNNRPNMYIKGEDFKGYWISRSVVAIVHITWNSKVLIVRRGKSVIQSGKYCLPCGYLDFDETIEHCVIREVYEETGIDIRNYGVTEDKLIPKYIITDPTYTKNQDIAFNYSINIESDVEPQVNLDLIDLDETTDARWIDLSELSNYEFAFGHDIKIIKNSVT